MLGTTCACPSNYHSLPLLYLMHQSVSRRLLALEVSRKNTPQMPCMSILLKHHVYTPQLQKNNPNAIPSLSTQVTQNPQPRITTPTPFVTCNHTIKVKNRYKTNAKLQKYHVITTTHHHAPALQAQSSSLMSSQSKTKNTVNRNANCKMHKRKRKKNRYQVLKKSVYQSTQFIHHHSLTHPRPVFLLPVG